MHYKEGGEPVVLAFRVVFARTGLGRDDAHASVIALGRDTASVGTRGRLRLAGRAGCFRQGPLLDRRQGRLRREGREGRRRRHGPRVCDGGTRALLYWGQARVLNDDRLLPAPMEEAPPDRQRCREAEAPGGDARNEFHRGEFRGGRVVLFLLLLFTTFCA